MSTPQHTPTDSERHAMTTPNEREGHAMTPHASEDRELAAIPDRLDHMLSTKIVDMVLNCGLKDEAVALQIAQHTQAAVAGMREERDAAIKANGELATLLDVGPMSEAARQSLQTRLTAAEAEVAELRAENARLRELIVEINTYLKASPLVGNCRFTRSIKASLNPQPKST